MLHEIGPARLRCPLAPLRSETGFALVRVNKTDRIVTLELSRIIHSSPATDPFHFFINRRMMAALEVVMITPRSATRHRVVPPSLRTPATPSNVRYTDKPPSSISGLAARVAHWAAAIVHRLVK